MFSLIITVIAIALVAALALATLYYGGSSFNQGSAKAQATKLMNQVQQVMGATELYRADFGVYPLSLQVLVDQRYLQAIPLALAPTSGALGSALALESAWAMVVPEQPVFVLPGISQNVCDNLNQMANGTLGSLKTARAAFPTQCYGDSITSLQLLAAKSSDALVAVASTPEGLALTGVVITDAIPAPCSGDASIAGWVSTPGCGSGGSGDSVVDPSGGTLPVAMADLMSDLSFGNQTVGTPSAGHEAILTNIGSAAMDVSAVNVSSGFSATHDCPSSLAASAFCTITVVFAPTVPDVALGTLTVSTSTGEQTAAMSGFGLQASDSVYPTALSFAPTTVGTSSEVQTLTLSNTGNVALNVTGVTFPAPFSATTTCAATLAVGTNCTYSVTFSPSAMGAADTSVGLTTAAGVQNVTLSGTGNQSSAEASTDLVQMDSTAVGATSVEQVVTLHNTGNVPLALGAVTLSPPFAGTTTCTSVLAGGESCDYLITFTPTTAGDASATLALQPSTGEILVALQGTGTGAQVSYQTSGGAALTTLSFPSTDVGSNATAMNVVMKNTGNVNLVFANPGVAVAAPFSLSANTCAGASVAPNATCTVSVTFSPTANQAYNNFLSVSTNDASARTLPVTGAGSMAGVVQIAAGAGHTAVLKSNGTVWSTGANWSGQLGDGTTTNRSTFVQAQGIVGTPTAIAAGYHHTVVIAGGTVQSVGRNSMGQLADNTTTNRYTFVQAQGVVGTPTAIVAGTHHTVVIAGSTVQSVGYNPYGQLADNTTANRSMFVQAQGIVGTPTAIAAGQYHTVVIAGGTVQSVGSNYYGQLGNNTLTDRSTFGSVQGIVGTPTAIAAGDNRTVVIAGGTVQSVGYNPYGQLADNTTTDRRTFVQAQGIVGTPTAIRAGESNTIVIAGGTVQSVGRNDYGQLADNTLINRSTFVQAQGVVGTPTAIAAGQYHTVVIAGGTVQSAGANWYGQLGSNTTTDRYTFGAVTPF